jgi:nucleotide-binding universal stress UspA family protein
MAGRTLPAASPQAADGQVVVGVDDSPGGLAALRWAMRYAQARRRRLVAVRAWELGLPRHGTRRLLPNARQHVIFAFAGLQSRDAASRLARAALRAAGGPPPDLPVTIETPEASPGHALTRMARAGDNVIVVGTTSGHHLRRAMHGSVARYCATHAACPVVIVPGGRSRRWGGDRHASSRR